LKKQRPTIFYINGRSKCLGYFTNEIAAASVAVFRRQATARHQGQTPRQGVVIGTPDGKRGQVCVNLGGICANLGYILIFWKFFGIFGKIKLCKFGCFG